MAKKQVKEKKATPKQKAFVKEYVIDFNGDAAAIRAGYSKKTARIQASQMLAMPHLQELLKKEMEKRNERVEVTQDYVLKNLMEVVERCMQRNKVMVRRGQTMVQATDADGNHIWKFDANPTNRALELLGQHLGMFKHVLSNDPDNPVGGFVTLIELPKNGREKPAKKD